MSRQPGKTPPRVCPECGDFKFGSQVLDDGTMQRNCHGEVYILADGSVVKHATPAMHEEFIAAVKTQRAPNFTVRMCTHTWHQSQDVENGVLPPDEGEVAGMVVGRVITP